MECVACSTDLDQDNRPYGIDNPTCYSVSYPWVDSRVRFVGQNGSCDYQDDHDVPPPNQSNQWCDTSPSNGCSQYASKNWQLRINSQHDDIGFTGAKICTYSSPGATGCSLVDTNTQAIAEINFIVNEFGLPQDPHETEVSILLRSPKEHGNVDRPYSQTIGDFALSKNDKYLRDNFTTSATMRNVYYQSQ